jgi:PAS domain S-box-containing protein
MTWSDEVFRLYGYAPGMFEPQLEFYLGTIHSKDRSTIVNHIDKARYEQLPFSFACRITTLDGRLRYINTLGKPLKDATGKVSRVIGTMQDVTDQKILETELRKKNDLIKFQYQMDRQTEKLRHIGTWQWDLRTGKMVWGENMYRMLGQQPYAVEPGMEVFIQIVHEADRERVRRTFELIQSANEGVFPHVEFRVLAGDAIRYIHLTGRVMAVRGQDRHVIATMQDITERVKSEEEQQQLNDFLHEKNRQLQDMNEELSSFAFVASHDLREPLRKIQIFSDWICSRDAENLSAEGKYRFQRIRAAVSRMEMLIGDILSFSRISVADKNIEPIDLNHVLQIVHSDLQEIIDNKTAKITADKLPVVAGNRSQLEQLFRNLLSNALKYQPPGHTPVIRITAEHIKGSDIQHDAAMPEKQYVKISFADNGIGFDPAYSKKIFQMFQRLHAMHEYPGTGMGLAICRKIMEHHEGFITAQSELGKGSIFDCYLPV